MVIIYYLDSSSIRNDLANMLSDHNPVEFLITFVGKAIFWAVASDRALCEN